RTRRATSSPRSRARGRRPSARSYFATAKPDEATAFSRSACFTLVSSYVTVSSPLERSAAADSTPLISFTLAAVLGGHLSHFQPLTLMVSVFWAANAPALRQRANANAAVFMKSSSGEGNTSPAPTSLATPATCVLTSPGRRRRLSTRRS